MDLQKLKETIEKNGFEVSVFETKEEAADYLDKKIDEKTVGFGGSVTLKDMNLFDRLSKHNTVYSHSNCDDPERAMRLSMNTDVYLLSANAIAENTGEILNIDATGNRVSSTLYGHQKVYMIAGKNKISPDYDSALYRLRNVVAPKNARRLHMKTPCAVNADRCYDCNSPDRICNALVVHYKKMRSMNMEIVLVNEELGF